nr:circumsporozoite protein-like [Aegilops tauschii subsp. strangulata]
MARHGHSRGGVASAWVAAGGAAVVSARRSDGWRREQRGAAAAGKRRRRAGQGKAGRAARGQGRGGAAGQVRRGGGHGVQQQGRSGPARPACMTAMASGRGGAGNDDAAGAAGERAGDAAGYTEWRGHTDDPKKHNVLDQRFHNSVGSYFDECHSWCRMVYFTDRQRDGPMVVDAEAALSKLTLTTRCPSVVFKFVHNF